ncbi:hypothetical protein [Pseudomonas multiresinivorans]|uniref:Uncharacterized protein n=1 Tax=Pseudomonas multiresinivorans TaxID=95301 RepID=A0A7Z3BP56_9PSED|nr:hypothetical protein [Pseudomonas multiresinivorans]QJP10453.1 hypothetical protein G4G71_22135 [Pseudomonas multiresinivorans]
MISRRDLYAMGEPFGDSCTRVEAGRLIYGGGGGGGGKSTTTTEIPKELKPLASAYANKAMDLSNTPYQGYGGQQVADMNWWQNQAAQAVGGRAFNGDPTMNLGSQTIRDALYSGNAATVNPNGNINNGGQNKYAGSNPYLQQNIDAALGDITRNYNDAVAPGLTTQMVNSGSFGNTGAQAATTNALNDLTKNLANTSSGMRMQDYTAQQSLAENQLNRDLQTQQFNANMGNDWASRNDSLRSQYLGLAPTYGNQAYTDAAQLNNIGQQYQENSQQRLDAGYQNYLDAQNDPYKKLAAMAGVFGSGLGQQTTTKSSGGGK